MTELLEKALASVRAWTAEQQDEAARMLLALDKMGTGPYRADDTELRAIDEALEQTERGDLASEAEVEAAFNRFRR